MFFYFLSLTLLYLKRYYYDDSVPKINKHQSSTNPADFFVNNTTWKTIFLKQAA